MLKTRPALQYSQGRSSDWGGAKLVNCFAERGDGDKRDDFAIMAIPGLVEWANVGGELRGVHVMNDVLYAVAGSNLYSVDSLGVSTSLGAVGGTGAVRIADNGAELAIAAGGVGYVYSGGAVTTPLTYDVSDVGYVDGYFIWTVLDSDQYFISALDDGLTYDAADIAVAEGSPDDIIGIIVDHRDVFLIGAQTIEIVYNSGNADFPFERQGNAFIERGTFDRNSIAKLDNSVFFVGDDRVAYRLDGYQPVRISSHAMEFYLADTDYAAAYTYDQEGHKFYCLRTASGTLCYDIATGLWHMRQTAGGNWRVTCTARAYSMTLMGATGGKIYRPDLDTFTDDGDTIAVDMYLPTIEADRSQLTMYAFEVIAAMGVGNANVTNPQIMLRYSDNGGHSWSNEMWRTLGAVGEYRTRAVWRNLGRFRQRQIWLRITDPCRRMVVSHWVDAR